MHGYQALVLYPGHLPKAETRTPREELWLDWYEWLVLRSPYSSYFDTTLEHHQPAFIAEYGLAIDGAVEVPANIVISVFTLFRAPGEFPQTVLNWRRMVADGIHEDMAFNLCVAWSKHGKSYQKRRTHNYTGHWNIPLDGLYSHAIANMRDRKLEKAHIWPKQGWYGGSGGWMAFGSYTKGDPFKPKTSETIKTEIGINSFTGEPNYEISEVNGLEAFVASANDFYLHSRAG